MLGYKARLDPDDPTKRTILGFYVSGPLGSPSDPWPYKYMTNSTFSKVYTRYHEWQREVIWEGTYVGHHSASSAGRYDGPRMYAVIMAGGGGTRLHPLSRPERPKPFLPLLGATSLLQATAARLPTDDITVVTDRRYERFVRDQLPDARRARSSRWVATRPPRSPSRPPPSTGPTTR